ncbi:MAG TPA: MFS transporter [Stellaceae bacterium]|nr:MFS transporter [Stellaceae bacterium]
MGGGPSDWTWPAIWTLAFLTLISSLNYLDRSILGLALPLIKAEMQVSDTVLGLVSGLAFVAVYSLLGIPIAWLADRGNRRNIIAIGFAFWSLMTFLTGFVSTIGQLAAARFLMGAGEACGLPPSNAMVADLFRSARRPLALAILGTANSLSFILFFPVMGRIADAYGWRAMYIAAGTPGLILALLFVVTVREPPRGETVQERDSLAATLRFLAGSRTYLWLLAGVTFMGANVWGSAAWSATFLVRVHGMTLTRIADTIGPVRGILSGIGVLLGGMAIDRLVRRDARWRLALPALACLLVGPAEVAFLFGNSDAVWLSGFAVAAFFTLVHQPSVFAVAMGVARPRMRAVATAVLLLFAGLVGQAAGPFAVGWLNDRLHPIYGDAAIRWSLLLLAATAICGGVSFAAAARHAEADSRRAADA